jgi:phage-related protein
MTNAPRDDRLRKSRSISHFMTSLFTVYYFISSSGSNPVRQFLDSLSEKQQAKILRIFQYITDYGLSAVLPHTKKLAGTPLWEIRIVGKDNIRILYVLPLKNIVLVLHGFMKKTQRTSVKELQIAMSRYKQWKEMNG